MLRRSLIYFLGATATGIGLSALPGFRVSAQNSDAFLPWQTAGDYDEPRMAALSWAILAPSPHNLQPWRAELVGDDKILLWNTGEGLMPETDPSGRHMMLSFGAFLEILQLAIAEQNSAATVVLFPSGVSGPTAEVTLQPGGTPDPLFHHISQRRTNRRPYDARLPEAAALTSLKREASSLILDASTVNQLRDLTWTAMSTGLHLDRVQTERASLMRFGKREIDAHPDGILFKGPMVEALAALGVLTQENQRNPDSIAFQAAAQSIKDAMKATQAYVTIKTAGNSQTDQIEAGKRMLRLGLEATAHGLAFQPLSQALQDYPEQNANRERLYELVAAPGETVQMLGRVGYAKPVERSPRWPLASHLEKAR